MQFMVSFFVGLGFGTWVYAKLMRSTGGNLKSSLIASSICGLGAFVLIYILAATLLK